MPINIPAIGLTFARDLMPQIKDPEAFINSLKATGVDSSLETLDPSTLKSTQSEFDNDKINSIMANTDGEKKPIIVSKDDHILDGHHRWLADHNSGNMTKAYKVDLPILSLLHKARHYVVGGALNEGIDHKSFGPMLDSFVKFASDHLGIESLPNVRFKNDDDNYNSFAAYNPGKNELSVSTRDRHPMDIFRSVAHELVHHKQNEEGRIKDVAKEGETGSDIENEANSIAGVIMRNYAKNNPNHFYFNHVAEAVFVVGGPMSGKDRIAKVITEQMGAKEYDPASLLKQESLGNKIVVSSSANDLKAILEAKDLLESNGYLTSLIHVVVSNDISRLRNEERRSKGQKVISESIRFKKYIAYTNNINELYGAFNIIAEANNDLQEKCWKGYTTPKEKPLKKKGDKMVPNCVPVDEEHGAGDFATDKLRRRYEKDTPGSIRKIVKKKLKEANREDLMPSDPIGNDGIGASAITGRPIYPGLGMSHHGLSESAKKWATNKSTIERFKMRYGNLAEQKILEVAQGIKDTTPKTFRELRESLDKGIGLMGTVPNQGKEEIEEEAWTRKEGQNPDGGLNKKGVESYRRANPGSKLQTAVTEKPSKLKPGSKKAKRRISFCKRSGGQMKMFPKAAKDPNSRLRKARRKWNCEE